MANNLELQLNAIVGKENVITKDEKQLDTYFKSGLVQKNMTAVRPRNIEEIQEVMKVANDNKISIYTINDGKLDKEMCPSEGIILDFSLINQIEKLDSRNLMARIQRGVTWEQLIEACNQAGVRLATPLAATSESVLCNYMGRNILKRANRMPEIHGTTFLSVLPDGRIYKSGTHALSEEIGPEYRDDGGPSLSRCYFGSDDIFGVVPRLSVFLYPAAESRDVLCFGFEDLPATIKALRDVPRTEFGIEYIAANKAYLQHLLPDKIKELPNWLIMVGFEGRKLLTDYQMDRVKTLMTELGGSLNEESRTHILPVFDQVWYKASEMHTEFYTLPSRITEFDSLISEKAKEISVPESSIGTLLASFDRGRTFWAAYDFLNPDKQATVNGNLLDLNLALYRKGAFFNRPQGKLADEIYNSVPQLKKQIRTIKGIMDPNFIINPSHIIRAEDAAYEFSAASIDDEKEGGITVANIKEIRTKLEEVVGSQWVSDNPADLNCYSRDFTIFSGERPNIIVLPESLEEIQEIMRLAYQHKVPVVPLTTGFNHGGLTITRKGGVLMDLKRMDRLHEIDEETMTASFEPAVRHRSLYREAGKVTTYKDLALKPILSGTMGSISVLSNYISRGGAMTAVKYGANPDLTINMTWVLPNGELLRVGPKAFPNVGNVALQFGMGPDMGGMFFNADGAFGVCTEITTKLYPLMPQDKFCLAATLAPEPLAPTVNALYEITQESLVEFTYKAHGATLAITMSAMIPGSQPEGFIEMLPEHPILILVNGFDEEELQVRNTLLEEVISRHGLMIIDPAMFGPDFADMVNLDIVRAGLGVEGNVVGSYRGAFQWTAGYFTMDQLPQITEDYEKLVQKYWKTSDPKISVKHCFTGTDIQGPLPFCRSGAIEFDFWWDQGNPEAVKRATNILTRTTDLMFRHAGIPIRNMFGFGDMLIPRLGTYTEILKEVRHTFDPLNLMHPDVLPLTDDYV